jgi:hypothetical protein
MTEQGPRGWSPGKTETRFADAKPSSYDAKNHTVDCVISMGSPVKRFYGTEVLRITPAPVDLSRMDGGSIIPLLDSHQVAPSTMRSADSPRRGSRAARCGARSCSIRLRAVSSPKAWSNAARSPESAQVIASMSEKSPTKTVG